MSFLGTEFIFDGTSSYEYGLCLYSRIDNVSQDNTSWASTVKMFEDRPYRRYRSYCYGGSVQDSLEFKLVFGVSEDRKATFGEYDHWEMQKIASWLTGHRDYRWLEIVQDDLSRVRYHCYITDLQAVEVGGRHWGFTCKVTCDSPYGYLAPEKFTYTVDGMATVILHSRSSCNDPYSPIVQIKQSGGTTFSIKNVTDKNREFILNGIPTNSGNILLDSSHGVLACDAGLNLYPYCNFKFPRLLRGDNELILTGTGIYTVTCEFPVNVGG
jgi:phage-related protein